MNLEFRRCEAADANSIVPLIFASGPIAFRYVFSHRHADEALEFLHAAFAGRPGQFGHANHLAVVRDGRIVAAGAMWDARAHAGFTLHAAWQILRFFGVWRGIKTIIRGLRMERVVKPPRAQRAYIGHIAVMPEARGQGIGLELMRYLLQKAQAGQHPVAALDVADDNVRARALYEGLGFVLSESRGSTLAGPYGRVVDHHYMEVPLR